jgi:hypothetical protein
MLRTLLVLVLGLYLFIIGLVTYVAYSSLESSRESSRNTVALCALRDNINLSIRDREKQIENSESFLRQHPHGIPGIPASLIERGIKDNQTSLHASERSAKALSVIHC